MELECSRDELKCIEAASYLVQWSSRDLTEIRQHILRVQESAEVITKFLHDVTGDQCPVVYAVSNSKWTLSTRKRIADQSFTKEVWEATMDMNHVNAILSEYLRRQTAAARATDETEQASA